MLVFISFLASCGNHHDTPWENLHTLERFPVAAPDEERHVIYLQPAESGLTTGVELLAGKMMEVDCNPHGLEGEIHSVKAKTLYVYYRFETNGQVFSTLMTCPDTSRKTKLVPAAPLGILHDYRYPVVIYTPKGYEIHYRTDAHSGLRKAKQG